MWRACCLRVGEGSVECERGFSFSLPTVPTTLVIIFFRRKSFTYIIYVYTLILMKKGASSGAFTVSSLPTMSTTSSALSFSSSIIVVSPEKKSILPLRPQVQFPLFQERHPLLTVHLDNAFKHYKCHFSQPPSMDKHYDRLSYLTDARNLWMET